MTKEEEQYFFTLLGDYDIEVTRCFYPMEFMVSSKGKIMFIYDEIHNSYIHQPYISFSVLNIGNPFRTKFPRETFTETDNLLTDIIIKYFGAKKTI